MAIAHQTPARGGGTGHTGASPIRLFVEILLGILGVVCATVGVVILVATDDQYVGFGGDLSWRVGEIPTMAAWGLLVGGAVLLVVMIAMIRTSRRTTPEHLRPAQRARQELVTHAVAFTIVNAFLWLQDLATGGGLEYAYWTTIPWGIGLLAHAIAYATTRNESKGSSGG